MPKSNLPPGFDFLDPDINVKGLPVKEFAERGLSFPQRIHSGERKGELVWAPLTHDRVLDVLHNPRYAGAFCYGRRQAKHIAGKTSHLLVPREQVDAIKTAEVSLMPEDVEKQLAPQEIADLFAFLCLDKPPTDPPARPLPVLKEPFVVEDVQVTD